LDHDILNETQLISYYPNYYTFHALLESSETMKQQVNYINNHSFESIDYSFQWMKLGGGSIQRVTYDSVLGDASLRVTNQGETSGAQEVFLKAGVYTLQGFVKNSNDLVMGFSSIGINTGSHVYMDSTSDVGEWTHLKIQFELTTDELVIIVLTNNRYGTSTYFDNISLTEGFIDTRYNVLTNPSFEEGLLG
jgi:hypothetical protein